MRMVQARDDLDFAQKPFAAKDGGQLGPQHLHRYLAMVLQVLGKVDGGHAAGSEFILDGVAVGEGGLETVKKVGHWV